MKLSDFFLSSLFSKEDLDFFYNIKELEKILERENIVEKDCVERLKTGDEKLYCAVPFTDIVLMPNGVKSCCYIYEMAGLNLFPISGGASLLSAWRSMGLEKVRASVRDGSYRHCQLKSCAVIETFNRSKLMTIREMREKLPKAADYIEGRSYIFKGMPRFVNVSIDTACNLKCPSCRRFIIPGISYEDNFSTLNSLKTIGEELEILFLAGMGEPFFSPMYLEWIRNFDVNDYPSLKYIGINTNGQYLTKGLWEKLPVQFTSRITTVTVSIDGATGPTYRRNRPGGSFKVLIKNLAFLKELRENGRISYLNINFVYQLNNYLEIPRLAEIAAEYSFDSVIFQRLENWGTYRPELYRRLDVGNPGHPAHGRFKKIERSVSKMKTAGEKPRIIFLNNE